MTSKNSLWNKPFLLRPCGKDYLWGGSRLNDDFGKNIPLNPLAETWECSTHPAGPSTVAGGPYTGQRLDAVLQKHPALLGRHAGPAGELPVLVKLIDAKQDLSVQVHPDDAYARAHEHGQRGKAEFWYVLDAAPETRLVYGLKRTTDAQTLRRSIAQGCLERYLQYVPVHKGDVFFVPPGTVHAIGAGALIAEIQENSNLTYRLYDYDRRDKAGNKRPLHIDQALAVANLDADAPPRQPMRILRYQPGCAREMLCRCKYFEVHRILLNTERCRQMVRYAPDTNAFRILLCVDGCGELKLADGTGIDLFQGDCVFVPAGADAFKLHGKAELLEVRC